MRSLTVRYQYRLPEFCNCDRCDCDRSQKMQVVRIRVPGFVPPRLHGVPPARAKHAAVACPTGGER